MATAENLVFTRQTPSTIYPDSGSFLYQEWQVGISIAHALCISPGIQAIPYVAA